jgi:hypothetical protein
MIVTNPRAPNPLTLFQSKTVLRILIVVLEPPQPCRGVAAKLLGQNSISAAHTRKSWNVRQREPKVDPGPSLHVLLRHPLQVQEMQIDGCMT